MPQPLDPMEPIAIVGLGGVFPGAKDVPSYWKNIIGGVDSIVEVPKERWDWRLYYSENRKAADKTYSKIGGFVTDFAFDPLKLRIPPGVAKQMDTVQQLAVAATAEALRDAGYETKEFDRSRCAVVFGNSMGGPKKEASDLRVYASLYLARLAEAPSFKKLPAAAREAVAAEVEESVKSGLMVITEDTMPGELSNVIAGRVANVFNLNGANFTVDAACAASLGAIAQAVNGLRFRQYDSVVTGGVDQMMAAPAYVKFSKIGALSPDGSRPFDAGANGFVMGEGCGVMLLKRLSDALRDGDRVYALIRSVGASSDGRGKGITAPNPKGQKLAMERAFEGLDYGPAAVGLLEAHGTSTPVGDAVEVATATEVFKDAAPGSIALGSVKSQIGHLKAAAGAAGLVKAALAIHHKTLPPSINFRTPNPAVDWKSCPFAVNTAARPWDDRGKPRRANVSAFGFGGTNFHIALEEATPSTTRWTPSLAAASQALLSAAEAARPAKALAPELGGEAFTFGGPDESAVFNRLERAAAEAPQDGPLTAYAAKVNAEDAAAQPVRLALAAESAKALRDKAALVKKHAGSGLWEKTPPAFKPKSIHAGRGTASRPKVAFLFPGQGSQYVDMLKDLRDKYQVVADTFTEADRIMTRLIGEPLSDILFTKGGESEARLKDMAERIKRTEITQPAVLTADVAILRLLRQFGVEPDMVAGHSLGEYGALVAADVLTFEQALDAVSARGREMAGVKVADNGKMASVAWPVEKVEPVLKRVPGYVIAANKNCRIQTVIAGASAAVEEAVRLFQAEGVQAQLIEVSHAFHSEIVAPATEPFGKFLDRIKPRAPRIPILSNVTADYYPRDAAATRGLMARQIASPVEWIRQIERMYADGVRIFVECGPKRALTAFVTSTLEDKKDVFVTSSNHPKRGGIMELNDMLARFVASGVAVDFSKLDPRRDDCAYTREYRAWALASSTPTQVPAAQPAPIDVQGVLDRWDLYLGPVVISGLGAGVPGLADRIFREDALDCLIAGQNLIDRLPEAELHKQVEKNLERVVKSETGNHGFERLESIEQVIRLAGQGGTFDFAHEFGVRGSISSLMDRTAQLALAAGLLALKDAKIPLVRHYKRSTTGSLIPTSWGLPAALQEETGVIMATAWPGLESLIEDLTRFFAHKYAGRPQRLVYEMYDRMIGAVKDPADRKALTDWYVETRASLPAAGKEEDVYKFSRGFLFRVLALGHAQTAQFIRAKGPCTQVNAACASTTQAVGIAEDWIRTGRAKRVLIVSADDITNPTTMQWIGLGFLASGAATTKDVVSEAALPFDRRRNGMIVGMGASALVIEDGRKAAERGVTPRAELLAAQFDNSAYHVTRLSTRHVAATMEKLMAKAEKRHGLRRSDVAAKLLFMSHETYTPAQGGSSAAEVEALKSTFGEHTPQVVVTNTKGFTGHSMGASLEDVIAVYAMNVGKLPPIANYKEPDPNLAGITLSKGGPCDREFALRLGAGFGSQIAMTLARRTWKEGTPRVDEPAFQRWLGAVSGRDNPELEVVHNTLRVKDAGKPARATEGEEGEAEAPKAPSPAPRSVPVPVAAAPASAAAPKRDLDEKGVTEQILTLVSEKTGYPKEMLELDLDMEADLGIDTVKQAELIGLIRDQYAIAKAENLSLKDYPTLRHVVRFVLGGGTPTASEPPLPRDNARSGAGEASAPAGAPLFDEARVTKEIVGLVSEKTGYPAEMLELDLDMEADLGIDTVKQAELIGLIRDKYAIPKAENLSLKDYPTLRHVVKFVLSGGSAAAVPATAPEAAQTSKASPIVVEDEAPAQPEVVEKVGHRFGTWSLESYPRPAEGKAPALSKERPVVILAAETEQAAPFAEAVAAAGGEAVAVKTDWPSLEKAEAVLRKALKERRCGGLIDITALEGAAAKAEELSDAQFEKAYRRGPKSLFLAAKSLREDLSAQGAFLLVVTRMGGDHGCASFAEFEPLAGAMTGLAKALARELPSLDVRAVDFDAKAEPAEMARLALAEVGSSDPRLETGYQGTERRALRAVHRALPAEAPRKITNRSVVLITGGGQGLGAELAKELAKRVKCPLVLLGRTPLHKEAASWVRMSKDELDAMKKRMWEDLKKDKSVKATPALLEREFSKVRKAIDLHRSIEAMSLAGSKVQYLQADMADHASVAKAVKAALKAHNRVDVVIHAAGLDESKLLADKKPEDFDRVFKAKAHGAFHLVKEVPPVRGQRWAFLSSVTGRFGNLAQTDYAAANDFLAKLSASMNAKRRGAVAEAVGGKNLFTAPAVAFDLTAFAEVGMAARGSVEQFLKSQGVDFIPPAEGVKLMLDVLLGDADSHEVIVAGALGKLDGEGLIVAGKVASEDAAKPAAPAAVARAGDLDEKTVTAEIVALVAEKTGYPAEMLELDLDMEADLGIDTVKQAELIGLIRDRYAIPKAENLSLKDYPTLRHVVKFVLKGGAAGAPAPAVAAAPEPKAEGAPLFDEAASNNGTTKTGKTFSLESDPWLKDHAISGTPYVAGVMGLELFAETAGRRLGKVPAALEDVRFALPIKLLRQRPVTVRTLAGDGPDLRIESDFISPQGIKLGAPKTHFTARVPAKAPDLAGVVTRAQAFVKGKELDKAVVGADKVYAAYFHGPRFQVLGGLAAVGEEELVGLYRRPQAPLWDKAGRALVFQPMLIEAAFQTCGYRDLHYRKKMTLPDSIDAVRVFDGGPAPQEALVYARWRGAAQSEDGADRSVYDACVLDRAGKVWAALEGYRMIAVS